MTEVASKNVQPAIILAVDDSLDALELIQRHLQPLGHTIHTAMTVESGADLLSRIPCDLVITDLRMPKQSGMDLIRHIRDTYRNLSVIMVTGYPSIDGAVESIRLGADEYLAKPFTKKELVDVVEEVLTRRRTRTLGNFGPPAPAAPTPDGMIGESAVMQRVFDSIDKAAAVSATVLITGESGTGKELVARAIHYTGKRAASAFVPVNCGGIPETLLESELFGHVKGAFTGANESRAGFFQTADRGTIFLDEVSETSMSMQVKLLRVLQEKEVHMLGSPKAHKVDVRIIAGTNKNLLHLIRNDRFREDLYYRLNVINIDMPPLRERGDDIFLLVHHFSAKYASEMGRPAPTYTDRALEALRGYMWPGNVRELENLVQRLIALADSDTIDTPDLPPAMRTGGLSGNTGLDRPLADVEAEHIRRVIESVGGNKTRAAQVLGIDRKTLRKKLKPGAF